MSWLFSQALVAEYSAGTCSNGVWSRLYVVGCEPTEVPPLPLVLGEATHTVGLWSGRDKATCPPSIAKHEYESTPAQNWLHGWWRWRSGARGLTLR